MTTYKKLFFGILFSYHIQWYKNKIDRFILSSNIDIYNNKTHKNWHLSCSREHVWKWDFLLKKKVEYFYQSIYLLYIGLGEGKGHGPWSSRVLKVTAENFNIWIKKNDGDFIVHFFHEIIIHGMIPPRVINLCRHDSDKIKLTEPNLFRDQKRVQTFAT